MSLNLPDYLFWDVDQNSINYDKNARFVISRVIQRGSIDDWKRIKKYYGLDKIQEEIINIRSLDYKTLVFFSTYFGLKMNSFRCYTTKQSPTQPFNY